MTIHSVWHIHKKSTCTYTLYAVQACVGLLLSTPIWAGPNVAVSIAPIHSLVSAVMDGVGVPELLIPAGQSPHGYTLRPSSVKHIYGADLIIWIGPDYEIALAGAIAQVSKSNLTKSLESLHELQTYPVRVGAVWESNENENKDHNHKDGASAKRQNRHQEKQPISIDPHFWLSTANAKTMVNLFRAWLISIDSENSETYQRNAERLISRINILHSHLRQQLRSVETIPYIVFHDAYQYFEKEFNLNQVGSITVSPERTPGVKRIQALRKVIMAKGVRCLFNEPQFESRLLPTLIENTGVSLGQLEPLGTDSQPGTELWFELMTELGKSLTDCLK
ncbi:zinc ABC transporter substrate-binding protein [Candidatus Spongiihabitans sp.]|uniref:zinc ABC transporter substrate-binding protein n=1 Tax=Candidatus Spongiihabitans sp. TaxID=3101308 RepID=UPI003C6F2DA0